MGGVPVKVGAGHVVADGRARVGVSQGVLHVPQRHPADQARGAEGPAQRVRARCGADACQAQAQIADGRPERVLGAAGPLPGDALASQISADGLAVMIKVPGGRGDRLALLAERVRVHIVLSCEQWFGFLHGLGEIRDRHPPRSPHARSDRRYVCPRWEVQRAGPGENHASAVRPAGHAGRTCRPDMPAGRAGRTSPCHRPGSSFRSVRCPGRSRRARIGRGLPSAR